MGRPPLQPTDWRERGQEGLQPGVPPLRSPAPQVKALFLQGTPFWKGGDPALVCRHSLSYSGSVPAAQPLHQAGIGHQIWSRPTLRLLPTPPNPRPHVRGGSGFPRTPAASDWVRRPQPPHQRLGRRVTIVTGEVRPDRFSPRPWRA